jgi:adenylate kinase family enzyme
MNLNRKKDPHPPRLPEWIIRGLACTEDRLSIQENLHDEYIDILTARGPRPADLWYWGHTIRSFFPFIIFGTYWRFFMLKNYLETPDSIFKHFDSKSLSSFKGTLDMLLADINNQQSRAINRHESPDPFQVFSFVVPLKEDQKKAQLKLYCPKKKQNGSQGGFKISLLLDMDRIGEVRSDFFLMEKDLSITFFVRDEDRKNLFENHFEEIKESLNPLFDYLVLKAVVSEQKIQEFHREELDLGGDRQIDLRI